MLMGLFLLCFIGNNLIDFTMLKSKRLYYIYILLSFNLLYSYATITGKVIDLDSNEPLIGVNVIQLETNRKVEMFGDLIEEKTITIQTATNYGASTDIDLSLIHIS